MDWIRGDILGRGSFATVSLASPTSQSSGLPPLMAVKSSGFSRSSSLANEKSILEELKDCPEIIQCYGERLSGDNGEKLYNVLLEYAPGGTLADMVKKSDDSKLLEFEVRQYTKALLRGIHFIHKMGYVHCDIKLENILLGPNGGVKIADFGLAKRVGEKIECSGWGLRGTPMYLSPEVVTGREQGPPADIWALGCAVAEMLSGNPPWPCSNVARLIMKIGVGDEAPQIPPNLSDTGKSFLAKIFVKDPSNRWTAQMLLDHPFITLDHQDFEDEDHTISADRKENRASPRSPFDFPDWVSSVNSLTPREFLPESGESSSPAERLQQLVSSQTPNWFVSDDWVTIR